MKIQVINVMNVSFKYEELKALLVYSIAHHRSVNLNKYV